MSKYIDAEKLKRFEEMLADIIVSSQGLCTYEACKDRAKIEAPVLIDSLQQEQPEVELEKEIDVCWKNWLSPSNQKDVEGVLPKTEFAMYARHFWNKGYNARKEE